MLGQVVQKGGNIFRLMTLSGWGVKRMDLAYFECLWKISRGKGTLLSTVTVLSGFERLPLRKKLDYSGKQNQYPTANGEVWSRPGSED